MCGLGELCRGVEKKMKISCTVVSSGYVLLYISLLYYVSGEAEPESYALQGNFDNFLFFHVKFSKSIKIKNRKIIQPPLVSHITKKESSCNLGKKTYTKQ